jgi:hypothetical protein
VKESPVQSIAKNIGRNPIRFYEFRETSGEKALPRFLGALFLKWMQKRSRAEVTYIYSSVAETRNGNLD